MKQLAPFAGWTALILGFAALIVYLFLPELALWSLTFIAVAGFNALFFFLVDRKEVISALKTRSTLYGLNTSVMILVFLGILIFVNLLTYRHKFRWDLTEASLYTLAPQTRKIVSALPRKVKMTAFYKTTDAERDSFQRLIDGYQELTDQIEIEFIDPDQKPDIVRRFNITTDKTVVLQSGDKGEQEVKIKRPTEEDMTNALLQVTRDEQKTIYFLGGHKERGIDDKSNRGYSQAKQALERDHFQVKPLLLLQSGMVPDDADILIINGPEQNLQESEIAAVDAYLNRGGAVLLLLDPQLDPGVTGFLERWGIEIQDDLVVDRQSKLYGADPTTVIVSNISDHEIIRHFSQPTIFQLLRSVSTITTEGLDTHAFLFSGPYSWGEKSYRSGGKVELDQGIDIQGPVPVAVVSSKEIKSDAPPTKPNAETPEAESPAPSLKARLVVIGDSDFAGNQFLNLYGNRDFFLNTAAWLAREENLISIRPRQRKWSPLTLSNVQGNLTFMLGTIVFPGMVILVGLRVWWKRRSL